MTNQPNTQMAAAIIRQLTHVAASHQIDRTGWTRQQWIDDARRLMGDADGSVLDLTNGHVMALLAELAQGSSTGPVASVARDAYVDRPAQAAAGPAAPGAGPEVGAASSEPLRAAEADSHA
jgi:hypothetical protein